MRAVWRRRRTCRPGQHLAPVTQVAWRVQRTGTSRPAAYHRMLRCDACGTHITEEGPV